MRKLFVIVCCILALDICLANKWWADKIIIGAHWGPPLQYNENGQLTRDFTLLKDGGFNFTLGKFSPHSTRTDSFVARYINSLIEECIDSGFYFLNDTADYKAHRDIEYGLNIKDEPLIKDTARWLGYVRHLKDSLGNKLWFLNLLPSHSDVFHDNFIEWKEYVNAYLEDTSLLQVACFENYYPNSNFVSYRPSPKKNYYSNIIYMRQTAGSRPLWAYLRSSEKYLEEKDDSWQDAYLRIGAFAPLAFGAKVSSISATTVRTATGYAEAMEDRDGETTTCILTTTKGTGRYFSGILNMTTTAITRIWRFTQMTV